MRSRSRTVIVISSHVAQGSVGNRAMVFALERLGFTVWAVPTVILPHHPGHGPGERIVPDEKSFAALLRTLADHAGVAEVGGVISGYLASPGQAEAVASLVRSVKTVHPDALYLCDPVIGDMTPGGQGGLYVGRSLADAVRNSLLPIADVATPNAFECAWLAGQGEAAAPDLAELAGALAPAAVLVTSAPSLMRGGFGNLLVEGGAATLLEHPALPTTAKGTGDLLAAILLARRLEGHEWRRAAEMAISSTFEIVAGTAKAGADELLISEFQQAIVQPRASVSVRQIGRRSPCS